MMNCPHCDTSVDEHEAGRCLDAWVAEKVFGRPPTREDWTYCLWKTDCQLAESNCFFSTEIAAAWEVWARMRRDWCEMEWLAGDYRVRFGVGARAQDMTYHSGTADTAPLAICRAALKAGV